MLTRKLTLALLCAAASSIAFAADDAELRQIRDEMRELKQFYEGRIDALEARIDQLEGDARQAAADGSGLLAARGAGRVPVKPGSGSAGSGRQSGANDFNPAVGVVLAGSVREFSPDDAFAVPGFMYDEEAGPGEGGFSLGESELNAQVNVDDKFFGNFTVAFADHEGEVEVELEEAWFETTALPGGLQLRGGRFFSGIGYRNQFHSHADDFVDRPLPYRVLLNGQYNDDGVQARWLAPTDRFLEFGAEWMHGGDFPAGGGDDNGKGAWSVFARTGGDVGSSHSWQAGLSRLNAGAVGRASGDGDTFDGDVDLTIIDAVWKWAPNGNASVNNFKLEAGWFDQSHDGVFTDNTGMPGPLAYVADQDGGYVEGVYQFRPQWRVGGRYAWLDADDPGAAFAGTALDTMGIKPEIYTAMVDWAPSEFSRVRLQYDRDESNVIDADRWYLQYIMSMGAHGAHQF